MTTAYLAGALSIHSSPFVSLQGSPPSMPAGTSTALAGWLPLFAGMISSFRAGQGLHTTRATFPRRLRFLTTRPRCAGVTGTLSGRRTPRCRRPQPLAGVDEVRPRRGGHPGAGRGILTTLAPSPADDADCQLLTDSVLSSRMRCLRVGDLACRTLCSAVSDCFIEEPSAQTARAPPGKP